MKKINSILILSVLGAKEWIRLKFFHLVIFIAILFILFSHLLSSLTFAVQERILFDFGLTGLELGLVLISSLIGTHYIQREIDRKTLFVLMARPIPRWHLVMGAWGAIFILNLIFTIGFSVTFLKSAGFLVNLNGLAIASFSIFLKSFVISSFAISMGLIVRPILALGTSISYWFLCYSLPDIQFFVEKLKNPDLNSLVTTLDKLIPQFYRFNWKSYYAVLHPASASELSWVVVHCLAWTFFWLFIGSVFFQRKEIV